MTLLLEFALFVVAFVALLVSVNAAWSAKAQAQAARDQVEAARDQADIAQEQAEAARDAVGAAQDQVTIAREQADAAKAQVDAAREAVTVAREQARIAKDQAQAARQQVAEARRANDLAEARDRRDAVVWSAITSRSGDAVHVINRGYEVARDVLIQAHGADEDWIHLDYDNIEGQEVPPNEWASFPLSEGDRPPARLWVLWRGAGRPHAVEVERGPRDAKLIL